MGSVEQPEQFPNVWSQRSSIESDGDRLVIDRVKDAETTVGHGCGFDWIGREFPLEGPIRSSPAADVLLKIWSCVDQLRISIFQPSLSIGIVERRPL